MTQDRDLARMARKRKCRGCVWFEASDKNYGSGAIWGYCHVGAPRTSSGTPWPMVRARGDWCGSFIPVRVT